MHTYFLCYCVIVLKVSRYPSASTSKIHEYTLETLLTDTPECLLKSQIKLPNISVHYKPLNSGYTLFHKPDKAEFPHTTNTV